jgi:uncharacterized protein involved in tolerance to divalent cations
MLIKASIAKAIYDFEWVLRVLESSKDEIHMDCTLKCFYLWEKKYSDSKEKKLIIKLKSNFWVLFKNKNIHVRPHII